MGSIARHKEYLGNVNGHQKSMAQQRKPKALGSQSKSLQTVGSGAEPGVRHGLGKQTTKDGRSSREDAKEN